MKNIRLVAAFDGSRYEGWQSQRKGRTLQEIFEKALLKITGEPVSVTGSSRTDSGVHALGFVLSFKTRSKLPDAKLKAALNFYLPEDVAVLSLRTAGPNFHARFDAKSKLYRYQIWNHSVRPVFQRVYSFWIPKKLNVSQMKKAARYFKGRHDFSAFKDQGDERKSHVRNIQRITVQKKHKMILVEVRGDGFLRHMIRVIVGTLIEVGRGRLSPRAIPDILSSKDRKKAGPTAKSHGLTLVRVNY